LTDTDESGRAVATWVLGNVNVNSNTVQSIASDRPWEAFSFSFGSMTAATRTRTGSWSVQSNTAVGPALPGGSRLVDLPDRKTGLTLELHDLFGPPISMSISESQLNFTNPQLSGGSTPHHT